MRREAVHQGRGVGQVPSVGSSKARGSNGQQHEQAAQAAHGWWGARGGASDGCGIRVEEERAQRTSAAAALRRAELAQRQRTMPMPASTHMHFVQEGSLASRPAAPTPLRHLPNVVSRRNARASGNSACPRLVAHLQAFPAALPLLQTMKGAVAVVLIAVLAASALGELRNCPPPPAAARDYPRVSPLACLPALNQAGLPPNPLLCTLLQLLMRPPVSRPTGTRAGRPSCRVHPLAARAPCMPLLSLACAPPPLLPAITRPRLLLHPPPPPCRLRVGPAVTLANGDGKSSVGLFEGPSIAFLFVQDDGGFGVANCEHSVWTRGWAVASARKMTPGGRAVVSCRRLAPSPFLPAPDPNLSSHVPELGVRPRRRLLLCPGGHRRGRAVRGGWVGRVGAWAAGGADLTELITSPSLKLA